jgi:cobalt-zinc-cadmium efflux system protein
MGAHPHTHDDSHVAPHAHAHAAAPHTHDFHALTSDPRNRRALAIALVVAFVFLIVEVVGGIAFNSLALLGDAAHMLTDVAAYALALGAWYMARRPATTRRTYGFARAEILAALANGATLLAASAWIVVEAVHRLLHPADVGGTGVIVVAAAGLVANLAIVAVLARADRAHLNIRAAMLHAITDALSSVAVLVAGAAIALAGATRADSIASLLIAALVIWGSWRLVRDSVDVLLDAAPAGVDGEDVAAAMLTHRAVTEVHDLHVWVLGPGNPALSAHVLVTAGTSIDAVIAELSETVRERFSISHTTLQVTADRGSEVLDTVDRLPVEDAVEWATEHIARTHPGMSRSVISAATGAAALDCTPGTKVSPITISLRALDMLGHSGRDESTPQA